MKGISGKLAQLADRDTDGAQTTRDSGVVAPSLSWTFAAIGLSRGTFLSRLIGVHRNLLRTCSGLLSFCHRLVPHLFIRVGPYSVTDEAATSAQPRRSGDCGACDSRV